MKRCHKKLERCFIKVYREWALIEQQHHCKYCHEKLTYKLTTAEHKIAKSKGGLNNKENIAASCESCNNAKGNMSEGKYLKIIKNFPSGMDSKFLLAWSRRKINLALERLEKKLLY